MPKGFVGFLRSMFEADDAVQLVANDPTLTAELILLFRVILADGVVREAELETFKAICSRSFGISAESLNDVYQYLQDFGYEITAAQAAQTFAELPLERRQALLDNMIEIARADETISPQEERILRRTADVLGFDMDMTGGDMTGGDFTGGDMTGGDMTGAAAAGAASDEGADGTDAAPATGRHAGPATAA